MVYINENKLNKGYINEYNKAYIGDKLLYWNVNNEGEESLCYTYDLNNQWQTSTLSLDGYIVLESFSNYNQHNSVSRMRIYLNGCDTFNFKYYSDGESSYDYTVIGKLDTDLSTLSYNSVTSTTYTQYTTKNKQKQWLDATFTIPNDGQEHFIDVVYRKDVSANVGADKGYIAFENKILNIRWVASDTICNGETLYQKLVKEITYDNVKWITTNEYKQGDMIEENSTECGFVSDFTFNYNFNYYNETTQIVPNYPKGSLDNDLNLLSSSSLIKPTFGNDGTNKYIEVSSGYGYGLFNFNTTDNNPFNRSGNEPFTVIYKTKGGSGADLISNRSSSSNYNWMVRQYSTKAALHLSGNEKGSIETDSSVPNVIAITYDGLNLSYYNLSKNTEVTSTQDNKWGNESTFVVFFGSMYNGLGTLTEKWSGQCYWMFHSNRILSKDEILSVANYNGM